MILRRLCLFEGNHQVADFAVLISWMPETVVDPAEERLAQLGYRQDLKRALSHFGNFAVSFSLQSILSGITSE